MSSSSAASDDSEERWQKNCFQQMSVMREVENYLGFFVIEVAPDIIPMDWWKAHRHRFPCFAQLTWKWLCVTATSMPSEGVFSNCGLAFKAKMHCTMGSSDDLMEWSLPHYHRRWYLSPIFNCPLMPLKMNIGQIDVLLWPSIQLSSVESQLSHFGIVKVKNTWSTVLFT